jgi:phosphohistidine phosphatase SixA
MAAAALCLLLGGGALYAAAAPAGEDAGPGSRDSESLRTVVILVRHTEKGTDDPKDPSLSAAGVKRAEALARMLSEAGVTHLFASEYRRTRDTLAPLASRLGLEVREVPAGNPEEQVAAIRGLPAGSVAVVAGHSNTVPDLAGLLGGEVSGLVDTGHGPMIDDDSHDRMFLLILPTGGPAGTIERAQTVELRYGD